VRAERGRVAVAIFKWAALKDGNCFRDMFLVWGYSNMNLLYDLWV
jgi:hypothetical protein